jgi:hypothetical protein
VIRKAMLVALLLLAACAPQAKRASIVPIPPPPPRGEPSQFTNIPPARLRVLLGEPVFIRKDGVTEMWRYDNKDCRAFFFLYGAGNQQTVRHAETLPRGKDSAADIACLTALKKAP